MVDTSILSPSNILIVVELILLLNYIVFRLLEKFLGWAFFRKNRSKRNPPKELPDFEEVRGYNPRKASQKPLKRQQRLLQQDDEGYLDYTQLN